MKKIVLVLSMCLLSLGLFANTDYAQILKSIDDLQDFSDMDLSLIWTVVSQKPGEENSVIQVQVLRRDATKEFLYLFLKPDVDKGQGFLMSGDNAWMYDPSSRKFSHFSLKENIGDTNARNEDIDGYSYYEDYDIVETDEGLLGKIPVHIITLKAKTNEVATPKVKIWVRKDNLLPLQQEDYSLSDRLVRVMYFPKWTTVAGRYIPTQQLIVDKLKEGERTQISISDVSNAKIPDDVFTKDYLERINNR